MSLKVRIPIIVSILLVFNIFILLAYNQYYFLHRIAERLTLFSGKTVDVETLKGNQIISELVFFELIILTAIIVVLSVLLYFLYAKPLIELSKNVKQFGSSTLPKTQRRDEIGALQNQFSALMEKLNEEKQVQNRMIASISHDIKTPLTSVLGYSESLLKKDLTHDRTLQYLQTIHESALDIENILEEFDSYITGKISPSIDRKRISASYLTKMLEDEYHDDGIVVKNTCPPDFHANIDLSKIRRVFANLIKNAVKHNKEHPALTIEILLSEVDGKLSVSIKDNGKGVAPEVFPYIFEPFFTTENRESISGLGLAICKDIIENHGGEIIAENASNGFCIKFII